MATVLFTDFDHGLFSFRCFVQYASFATLTYNGHTHACTVQKDDPTDNLSTKPMQQAISEWVASQRPYMTAVMATVCFLQSKDERLAAQLINHSLKHPTWYTEDYWLNLPTMWTFFTDLEDLKARPLFDEAEITLHLP